jgi:methyltransferase (TIGR00027 family)
VQAGKPSATARKVALRRAAHQLLDEPKLLDDPIALRILGHEAEAWLRADPGRLNQSTYDRVLRAFVVVRSRIAEDALAASIAAGVRQYVVLGAGLDTFAYRNPFADLRVFEVDFPATQAWKREALRAAGIEIPASLTFVPIDFERQSLVEELRRVGLTPGGPAWFSWLGVTPYLERDTILATFRDIAAMAGPGGGVAFDYGTRPPTLSVTERVALAVVSARVRAAGEPFKTFFKPEELRAALEAIGFDQIEDFGREEINARFFQGGSGVLRVGSTGRVVVARTRRR